MNRWFFTLIKLKYLNITGAEVTNNVKSKLYYGNKNVDAEDSVTDTIPYGSVIATYKDTEGNTLTSNYINNGLAGSEYTTPQKEIFGYTFKEVNGDDKEGIYVENKELVVNYVYTKNDGNTEEIEVLKTGPEAITDINGKVNYTISGSATVRDYVGDIKVTIKDMLPYAIDEDSSIIPNACTYDGNKTITCIKEYNN